MRDHYDFSHAKRARDVPALARIQATNRNKECITLSLDEDVLTWFRGLVPDGGNYQALINEVLREAMNTGLPAR